VLIKPRKITSEAEPRTNASEWTDVDEAVVEEEPDNGGAHPRLRGDGRRHHGPHDRFHVWARLGVELGGELRLGVARKNHTED
jgi:hypothetical protein